MKRRGVLSLAISVLWATKIAAQPTTDLIVDQPDVGAQTQLETLGVTRGARLLRTLPTVDAQIWRVPSDQAANFLSEARRIAGIDVAELVREFRSPFDVAAAETVRSPNQEALWTRLRDQRLVDQPQLLRLRPGQLGIGPLAVGFGPQEGLGFDGSFIMPLAPGVVAIATRETEVQPRQGAFNWRGTVRLVGPQAGTGVAAFAVEGDQVFGFVTIGPDMYTLRPLGDGLHAIGRELRRQLPPEHADENDSDETEDVPLTRPALPVSNVPPQVRIAIAYTSAGGDGIRSLYGAEPNLFSDAAFEFINETFAKSGVTARIELAGTREVQITESWDYRAELTSLVALGDGRMDELHAWRTQTRADLVILIGNFPSTCGKTPDILPPAQAGFAIVHYACAMDRTRYSLAHEIGHLFGARHSTDPRNTPFPYGRGYLHNTEYRTIMAREDECSSCVLIPRWANPEPRFNWDGRPTGTVSRHHDARVINETAALIAGYQQ